ncbi:MULTISPECIES: hypothetical protein [Xanthomonas]|uniref:hypothetical protein n=1 Tax=Xanthomonas TaxID=338 RepID=UPI0023E97A2B|nr:hypothetical protein [Xanthomonas sp. LMC-A-07]MCW2035415.1 hypothetical protein [Xanthomonas campestris]
MNLWNGKFEIRAPAIFLAIYLLLSFGLFALYYFSLLPSDSDPLVTGIIAGAGIAVFQFLADWLEASDTRKIKSLKVTNVLLTRDDEAYYRHKIEKCETNIDLLGDTAERFMRDFADAASPRPEKKVLIAALLRGVKVRLLVSSPRFDAGEKRNVLDQMRKMQADYPDIFQVRKYEGAANHSILRIDDLCIVGPVFPGIQSKNTPSIEMKVSSRLVAVYLSYLESEWAKALSI